MEDVMIRNLQGRKDEKRRESNVEVGMDGVGRPKRDRRGKGPRRNPRDRDEVDRNLRIMKMKILSFQSKNDPKAYLEWENKINLIFYCCNYLEEKNVNLAVIEFTNYAIIWWDELLTNRRRNHETSVEIWDELKSLIK